MSNLPPSGEIPRGAIRFNTDSNKPELWDGNQWAEFQLSTPNLGRSVDTQPGVRGLFSSGNNPGFTNRAIDYINISTTGDGQDFGDLSVNSSLQEGGCSSNTRGLFTGLITPGRNNNIEYVTISSTGDSIQFGDLTRIANPAALSNSTRGIFAGGFSPTPAPTGSLDNTIDYVTIASTGNAVDYGDIDIASYVKATVSSPTRGIVAGGYINPYTNSIELITISTTGNAQDFGDLTSARSSIAGSSNPIRGVFAGGETPSLTDVIDYITISTTGNATNFGSLPEARRSCGGTSSPTRMVIAGGINNSDQVTQMEYLVFSTEGNPVDFGDLILKRMNIAGLSNGHGGL
jgi:hypothetical protein